MREYIRHPSTIPLEVRLADQPLPQQDMLNNVCAGGLSFCSREPVHAGSRIVIRIPVIKDDVEVVGQVVWCRHNGQCYDVGESFSAHQAAYRTRMVEQICHIVRYKDEFRQRYRRELSSEEAAAEWISKYAGNFPGSDQDG